MATPKARLGDDAWVAGLHQGLSDLMAERHPTIGEIRFQIQETATNAPVDLATERQVDGSLTWHIVIDGPRSRAGYGSVDAPDIALIYDYHAILPLARWVYEEADEPAVAKFRKAMMRDGTLRSAGRGAPAPPELTVLLRDLHNRIALITA